MADMVQVEFKIAAALSQDPTLVQAANDPSIDEGLTYDSRHLFGVKCPGSANSSRSLSADNYYFLGPLSRCICNTLLPVQRYWQYFHRTSERQVSPSP